MKQQKKIEQTEKEIYGLKVNQLRMIDRYQSMITYLNMCVSNEDTSIENIKGQLSQIQALMSSDEVELEKEIGIRDKYGIKN
jgi:predicted RNase H-like nuclease (RuvC/YqgF family)